MEGLESTIGLKEKLDKWGKITIKVWQDTMRKNGIGVTGELAESFQEKVQQQQNDVMGIALKFKMYGRFRDMQVHKGVKAYERNQNNANRTAARRYGANVNYSNSAKKRWYNKPKMSQIYKMREILGIDLGQGISDELKRIAVEINDHIVNL